MSQSVQYPQYEKPEWWDDLPVSLQQALVAAGVGDESWITGVTADNPFTPNIFEAYQAAGGLGYILAGLSGTGLYPAYAASLLSLTQRAGWTLGAPFEYTYAGRQTMAQNTATDYSQRFLSGYAQLYNPGLQDYFNAQTNLWQARANYWQTQQTMAPFKATWTALKFLTYLTPALGPIRAFGFPFIGAAMQLASAESMMGNVQAAYAADPTWTMQVLQRQNTVFSAFQVQPIWGAQGQFASSVGEWTVAQMLTWSLKSGVISQLEGQGFRAGVLGAVRQTLGFSLIQPGLEFLISGMVEQYIALRSGIPLTQEQQWTILQKEALGLGFTGAGLASQWLINRYWPTSRATPIQGKWGPVTWEGIGYDEYGNVKGQWGPRTWSTGLPEPMYLTTRGTLLTMGAGIAGYMLGVPAGRELTSRLGFKEEWQLQVGGALVGWGAAGAAQIAARYALTRGIPTIAERLGLISVGTRPTVEMPGLGVMGGAGFAILGAGMGILGEVYVAGTNQAIRQQVLAGQPIPQTWEEYQSRITGVPVSTPPQWQQELSDIFAIPFSMFNVFGEGVYSRASATAKMQSQYEQSLRSVILPGVNIPDTTDPNLIASWIARYNIESAMARKIFAQVGWTFDEKGRGTPGGEWARQTANLTQLRGTGLQQSAFTRWAYQQRYLPSKTAFQNVYGEDPWMNWAEWKQFITMRGTLPTNYFGDPYELYQQYSARVQRGQIPMLQNLAVLQYLSGEARRTWEQYGIVQGERKALIGGLWLDPILRARYLPPYDYAGRGAGLLKGGLYGPQMEGPTTPFAYTGQPQPTVYSGPYIDYQAMYDTGMAPVRPIKITTRYDQYYAATYKRLLFQSQVQGGILAGIINQLPGVEPQNWVMPDWSEGVYSIRQIERMQGFFGRIGVGVTAAGGWENYWRNFWGNLAAQYPQWDVLPWTGTYEGTYVQIGGSTVFIPAEGGEPYGPMNRAFRYGEMFDPVTGEYRQPGPRAVGGGKYTSGGISWNMIPAGTPLSQIQAGIYQTRPPVQTPNTPVASSLMLGSRTEFSGNARTVTRLVNGRWTRITEWYDSDKDAWVEIEEYQA